jgi:replicative DNA helicase
MYKATQGRKASYIATSLLENISNGSASVSIEKAIRDLSALNIVKKKHSHTLRDGLVEFYQNVNDAMDTKGIMGVSTGIHELDINLGGFNKTDLIIIQARSGMGKTALMLNMAYAPTDHVGIISAEQGVNQAAGRILALHGRVDAQRMRTGRMRPSDMEDFNRAFRTLDQLRGESILINDEPSISVHDIKRQARQWKNDFDIKALYVDYVQKLAKPDPKMNKFEAVSVNVGMLKDLARELNIPVVVLAQTKRDVDQRPDKRPGPADVSDSSDIEKEADVFISVYREDRYESDHNLHTGQAELIVCKNRHGPCGTIMTTFEGPYMKFIGLKDKNLEEY